MTFTAGLRRRLLASLAVGAFLLAGCGGGPETELSTVDGSQPEVSQQNDDPISQTDRDEPVALNTAENPDDDGDELPVPDAAEPPAPVPQSSPAERQRLQELGLTPSADRGNTPSVVSATGDAQVQAAAESSSAASPPTRGDLDEFPESIPAIVDGAPRGPSAASDPNAERTGTRSPFTASGGDTIIDSGSEGIATFGSSQSTTSSPSAGGGSPAPGAQSAAIQPDLEIDPCADGCDDVAMTSGGGAGATDAMDSDTSPAVGNTRVSGDQEVDCEARPWGRGCELTKDPTNPAWFAGDAGGAGDADEGDADDASGVTDPDAAGDVDAEDEPAEGVFVPQDVIDALLAPLDGDLDDPDEQLVGDLDSPLDE